VVSDPALLDALAAMLGPRATRRAPLGALTTYGVGGPAALLVEVAGPDDLAELRTALAGTSLDVLVLGRGSNLLVADAGFDGVVAHLGAGFATIDWPDRDGLGSDDTASDDDTTSDGTTSDGTVLIRAGAAVALPVLARQAADAGWSGLSWAVGVPGSVGGAVRMNAGGHGSDMAAVVRAYDWVDLVAGTAGTDGLERLAYGYRHSSVGASEVVLGATLAVWPGVAADEQAAVREIVRWRREHQPGGSNAGSVFTNPEGDSAGRLIEAAGLKGLRLGSATVSAKHANFIQADKGGRADDVRALMERVRAEVHERSNVVLESEVRLLGFDDWETGAMANAGGGR
jgi:UDP-N-acetylmuramate dehydrogenase